MTETDDRMSNARANGMGWLASIKEMVAALECDRDRLEELREERDGYEVSIDDVAEGEDTHRPELWADIYPDEAEELKELEEACKIDGTEVTEEEARERIEESPLSVEVRSGWYAPGGEPEAEEYCILLSTGGPALRIVGDLGQFNQPSRARLEMQDWFTPWQEIILDGDDYDVLLRFAQVFYFGD